MSTAYVIFDNDNWPRNVLQFCVLSKLEFLVPRNIALEDKACS